MARSDPFLLSSLYLALRESTYYLVYKKKYSVDVSGLVLIEQEGDDASIGNLFFLLYRKKLINGSVKVS